MLSVLGLCARRTLAAFAFLLPLQFAVATATATVTGEPPNDEQLSKLSSADQAILDAKLSLMNALRSHQTRSGTRPRVPCPNPNSCQPTTPSTATLATYARQQANSYFCGPASGQVIVNNSWGYFYSSTSGTTTSTNKFTQATLASRMSTTTNGTSGANYASGLNGSAKLPSGFAYYFTATGTASQLHDKVITDIWGYKMGLALGVKPHDPGATYWLTSWPSAVTAWHWINLRGYRGFFDGTRSATLYYNDSSGGYGGSTGSYSDPTIDIHYVNARNSGNVVW